MTKNAWVCAFLPAGTLSTLFGPMFFSPFFPLPSAVHHCLCLAPSGAQEWTSGSNPSWVEDLTWTNSLDAGWNLAALRKAAQPLFDKYQGRPGVLTVRTMTFLAR